MAVRYYPGQGVRIAVGEKDANDAVIEGFTATAPTAP